MADRLRIVLLVVLVAVARVAQSSSKPPVQCLGSVWPQPQNLILAGTSPVYLDPSLKVTINNQTTSSPYSSLLTDAVERYWNLIFFADRYAYSNVSRRSSHAQLEQLDIVVYDYDEPLQFNVDESYELHVQESNSTAAILANTVWGAMRALESFSQLVCLEDERSSLYRINNSTVHIFDNPRFAHRGLLIDTARHYLPVSTIKLAVDGLSFSKMNTLHWHIVDAQSFPVELDKYEKIWENSAWTSRSTYALEDIADIVSYAEARGIRVMIEIDSPGHSYSLGLGYTNLTADCPGYLTEHNVDNIPLNPTLNFTFDVLTEIFDEVLTLTIDDWSHFGGDEVETGCWTDDPEISKYLEENNLTTTQLWADWERWIEKQASRLSKTAVMWQDVFDNSLGVSTETIIEVWRDLTELQNVANAGYYTINSAGNYLTDEPMAAWTTFYANEPFLGAGWTDYNRAQVLGGEACVWGEHVNEWNFVQVTFPRVCAVAERLWSAQEVNDTTTAQPRLNEHACRLNRRGIAAGPIAPNGCVPY